MSHISNGTAYEFTSDLNNTTNLTNEHQYNTVICVHGIGGGLFQFNELKSHLEALGYYVLSYDLIGRGSSVYPSNKVFSLEAHVNQLRDLIVSLNINQINKKYHLICHSMGGVIGSKYCELYPGEVASLTLLAPAGFMDLGPIATVRKSNRYIKWFIRSILSVSKESAWRNDFVKTKGIYGVRLNNYIKSLNSIQKANPKAQSAFWHSVLQFPLSDIDNIVESIALTSIPIHLLWGKLDKAVPFSPNYDRWTRYLSNRNNAVTQLTTYDDLGHGFFIEEPEKSNSDIASFIVSHST